MRKGCMAGDEERENQGEICMRRASKQQIIGFLERKSSFLSES